MRRPVLTPLLWTSLLLTAGCALGPPAPPPTPNLAAQFSELPAHPAPADARASRLMPGMEAVTRWWFVFGDDELNSLIERAVRQNLDLQQAQARVRQARALRLAAGSSLWPQVAATAGYNRAHGSDNVVLPFGGGSGASSSSAARAGSDKAETSSAAPATTTDSAPPGPGAASSPFGLGGLPGVTTNLYQAGFDASWEIDVFGTRRHAIAAADAGVDAAEEAGHGAMVSLLAEVASTYVEVRATQQRRQIARDQLVNQRALLDLVQARFKHGFATELDVAQQTSQVWATAAILPSLESAERAGGHALALLIGATPAALSAELARPQDLPPLPPVVPVGMPSDLLRRRPDIRQAERELAGATAQVSSATADYFPKFSLTGSFGFDSSDVKHLADWSSHYYSIAPGIRWPILDWGRVQANVHLQTARQQEAWLEYQKTVLQALKDVEDALVNFESEQTRRAALATANEASRRAFGLAQQSYAHGVTDMTATLQTQRTLLQASDALAESDGRLRHDLIALYKALGGGWE